MPTGVSVVIPSFRGADAVATTIASLDAQTLAPERFEVVIVVNGPAAVHMDSFETLRERFPRLAIRLLSTSTASASLAWNLGVRAARMEWLTFVDDDDTVSPAFLAALLDRATPGVVPLAQIHDVHDDGHVDTQTGLNARISARAGSTVSAAVLPQALGFNAAKLIPTRWAKASAYDRSMTNGQDIGYFGEISLSHDVLFSVVPAAAGATYRRDVSGPSMSRQSAAFDFSVEQRLDVIQRIDRARRRSTRRAGADHLIRAQTHLMNRYLVEFPDRRADAVAAVERRQLGWFPFADLNRDLAARIVVVADGETIDRFTRSRFVHLVTRWNEPVDVVAVARTKPSRSWLADVWFASDIPSLEGRLIQVNPPLESAADSVLAVIGRGRALRDIVSISRQRTPHALAQMIAGRGVDVQLARHRPLAQVWRA